VLNVTSAPLFFLFSQLIIAVILFCVGDALKIITVPMMRVDRPTVQALAPTFILNLLSLRLISSPYGYYPNSETLSAEQHG